MTLGKYCGGCPLEKIGSGFALTTGHTRHGVAIFAEALGEEEAEFSTPLIGKAGKTFNRMLTRTEDPENPGTTFRREDFLLGNIINCRPPLNNLVGAPYEHEAISHCKPYLLDTLQGHKPRVIFTMGNVPLRAFTGHWGIDSLRGYAFETPSGIVVPSYHPSYIQRGNWKYVRVWQLDLQKAVQIARHGIPRREKKYVTYPSAVDAERFLLDYLKDTSRILSFDIETPYSRSEKDEEWVSEAIEDNDPSYTILRISFSFSPYHAISMPWCHPFIEIAIRLLGTAGPKLVWNQHFDVPRLAANGAPVLGRLYDGMDAWHFLEPSLRMGLKYVATFFCPDMQAWKLEARENPEWYSAADSDVALRCFLATRERLRSQGRWDVFERHVVDLTQVLREVTRRGINVDVDRRLGARVELERDFDKEMLLLQTLVPKKALPLSDPYVYDEETLKRRGMWEEGRMRLVKVHLSPLQEEKEQKRRATRERKEVERIEKEKRKALREQKKREREAAKAEKSLRAPSSRGRKGRKSAPSAITEGKPQSSS